MCPIRIGKSSDKASPLLFRAAALVETFPEMTLKVLARVGGSGSQVIREYRFTNVYVTLYEEGGTAGNNAVDEVISISPGQVEITHHEFDRTTGNLKGTTVAYFDFATNTGG